MKYLISFLLLALSLPAFSQFRMVSDGVPIWSVVDDSTYTATINFQSDLTGFSYLATQITDTFQLFTGTEQLYRVSNVGTTTFSSATLTVVEVSNNYTTTNAAPTGQVMVFNPAGRLKIPQNPFGNSGATAQIQAAIDTYNTRVEKGRTINAGAGISVTGADPEWTIINTAQANPTDEIQDLSLTGNTLSLTGDNSTVDLSGYLDNTDGQTLGLTENVLSISGGNSVDLGGYLDNTDAQTLSLNSNTLSLTNGGSVSLLPYLDNTDTQDLSLTSNTLSLTDGGSVSLSAYLDNTDAQTLSVSGNQLTISNGNTVEVGEGTLTIANNHTDAATKGVIFGEYFITSSTNTMGLPAGVKVKRIY